MSAQCIQDNEDGYLFSSLTASFDCDPKFTTFKGQSDIGTLEVPFDADFVINDGQHRRAAIEEALKENPKLGDETISVVLFPFEDLSRMQQMFSDLNRTVRKTSKSLDILYNHRDPMAQVVLSFIEKINCFRYLVDKDRVSLPLRSPRLFTLGSLYDATHALLGSVVEEDFDEKLSFATQFWTAVCENMPQWQKVRDHDLKPYELRQEFIHTHAVVILAIGSMGHTLQTNFALDWESKLRGLRDIDWRRINKEWQGIAMSGNDVINRRQNRKDTSSFLKTKLGLPLTESEERSLRGARNPSLVLDELSAMIDATKGPVTETKGSEYESAKPR